ncbi:hypothetical protein CEP52_017162 [Fusarium oligoseptatum]|uniref:Uncharacterized protein n=1 Tax=Fusarium oligoseptatum TaxID=2604345 RepID=A0A428RVM9_9HYPO|nr:hypothetical protein CEP52_017162 [Fusarium oligoseptatum]
MGFVPSPELPVRRTSAALAAQMTPAAPCCSTPLASLPSPFWVSRPSLCSLALLRPTSAASAARLPWALLVPSIWTYGAPMPHCPFRNLGAAWPTFAVAHCPKNLFLPQPRLPPGSQPGLDDLSH